MHIPTKKEKKEMLRRIHGLCGVCINFNISRGGNEDCHGSSPSHRNAGRDLRLERIARNVELREFLNV